MVGVINHVPNPDIGQAVALARAAEDAGAQWIGVADAFWWRDVWLLLGQVAAATERIELGPAMTNPYMRHRFHTASALATLQEMAPGRVFCGIAAGGSEVTAAAGISRRDAAATVTELVTVLREVAVSATLDAASGRRLDVGPRSGADPDGGAGRSDDAHGRGPWPTGCCCGPSRRRTWSARCRSSATAPPTGAGRRS